MALESINRFLSGDSAVVIWWGKLEGYVLLLQDFFKGFGAFIVALLEDGGETTALKVVVDAGVCVNVV